MTAPELRPQLGDDARHPGSRPDPSIRRYRRPPRQSTKALTAKFTALSAVAAVFIGGLIATRMSAGADPALGPKAAAAEARATSSSVPGTTLGSVAGDGGEESYGDDHSYAPSTGSYAYSSPPQTASTPPPVVTRSS